MKYAFISGDSITKFIPVAFVEKADGIEAICVSKKRRQHFEEHYDKMKYQSFDQFLGTFSYFDVDAGELDQDVEARLDQLRAEYEIPERSDS